MREGERAATQPCSAGLAARERGRTGAYGRTGARPYLNDVEESELVGEQLGVELSAHPNIEARHCNGEDRAPERGEHGADERDEREVQCVGLERGNVDFRFYNTIDHSACVERCFNWGPMGAGEGRVPCTS